MNNEEKTKSQIKNILLDLQDYTSRFRTKANDKNGLFVISHGAFSFSNYCREDLLYLTEKLKKNDLTFHFNDLFLNAEAYKTYYLPKNQYTDVVEIGGIVATDGLVLLKKITEILNRDFYEKEFIDSNITSITFVLQEAQSSRIESKLISVKINDVEISVDRKDSLLFLLYQIYSQRGKFFDANDLKKFHTKIADPKSVFARHGFNHVKNIFTCTEGKIRFHKDLPINTVIKSS